MMNSIKGFGELSTTSEVITMEWAMENFISKSEDLNFEWESRTFNMCDGTWHLKMHKRACYSPEGIQLNLVNDKLVNFVPFHCTFSIKIANGTVHNFNKAIMLFKATEFLISYVDRPGLIKEKHVKPHETVVFNIRFVFEKHFTFCSPSKTNLFEANLSDGTIIDSTEGFSFGELDAQADLSDRKLIDSKEGFTFGKIDMQDYVNDWKYGDSKDYFPRGKFDTKGVGISKDISSDKKQHLLPDIKGIEILARNLKDLFLNEEDCDVTFKVEDREFHAHRIVLAARSPVFASMFRHDMSEKSTGIVNIPDCGSDAFKELLLYLYSGTVEHSSSDITFDLYEASVKYDLEHLNKYCVQSMMNELSVPTFCDTLAISLKHNEMELINILTDFFAKHMEEILPTIKWQAFLKENHIAANELLIKAIKKK